MSAVTHSLLSVETRQLACTVRCVSWLCTVLCDSLPIVCLLQEAKVAGYAMVKTVQVLEDCGLVWRDPRMPNLVRHLDDCGCMSVDFDTVGKPGHQPAEYKLSDWDNGTLSEDGEYNTASDLHQVAGL